MQLNVVVGKIQNRFINKKQTKMGGLNKEIEQLELEITRLKDQNKKLELDKQKLEEQLRLGGVGCSLICEQELNVMANDYIELECNEADEFIKKAQRFQDYRNGLKNMQELKRVLN